MIKLIQKLLFAIAALSIGLSTTSAKAETTECTQIVSLPAIITVQGIYCFKTNLVTSIASGNAIEIQTNNVSIDMNGFKLGGASAGVGTSAHGIYADGRKNITIKNGNIRGFYRGIYLQGVSGSGHLIEQIRADQNTGVGFLLNGDNNIIRNNQVINTGPGTVTNGATGIAITSGSNTLIADNVVSGVSQTFTARGIYINASSRVEVRGNSVFDIKDAGTKNGIYHNNSSQITILDNRVINPAGTGTTGIREDSGSTGVDCIENTIRGYNTGLSGCDYTSGNHINGEVV